MKYLYYPVFGLLFWILMLPIRVSSQEYRHAVSLELGGMAPVYSINYEYSFPGEGTMRFWLRAGLGVSGSRFAVPVGIGIITRDEPHKFQLLAGISPFITDYGENSSDTFMDLMVGTGYRYQQDEAPWFISITFYPKVRLDPAEDDLLKVDPQFKFAMGLAGGWRF